MPDIDARNCAAPGGTDTWTPVLQDLFELDDAGALAGIRAVIAARLAQARSGAALPGPELAAVSIEITPGPGMAEVYAEVAAVLAALIDRDGP